MEARLSRTEIEKLVKLHLPNTKVKKWDGNELIMDVNIMKLKKIKIRNTMVYTLSEKVKSKTGDYIICPVIKNDFDLKYIVIQ